MRDLRFTRIFHGVHTDTTRNTDPPATHVLAAAPDTTTNIASMQKSHTHMGERGTHVSYISLEHFTGRAPTKREIPTLNTDPPATHLLAAASDTTTNIAFMRK